VVDKRIEPLRDGAEKCIPFFFRLYLNLIARNFN
jgi:hypothetical protein